MLLCCSLVSASFSSSNLSSLSVDRLNSKIYTICRSSVIVSLSGRLPKIKLAEKDTGPKLSRVSWPFLTGIVPSTSCAFYIRSSLLQILKNSSHRHSVLTLLTLSSVTNSSLLFGFCQCAACMLSYRCLQMEWWAAVNYHFFAACTADVTVCFICQTVSALISGLSRYPAQPTPY